jgi:hypothetical protein
MNLTAVIPNSKKYTSPLSRIRDNSLREYENYNSIISFVEVFNDNVTFMKLGISDNDIFDIYVDDITTADFNEIKRQIELYSNYTARITYHNTVKIYTHSCATKRISFDLYRPLINAIRNYMEDVHVIKLPYSYTPSSIKE